MMLIAGDIGGTKSLIALLQYNSPDDWRIIHEARYQSSDYRGIDGLLQQFLKDSDCPVDNLEQMVLAIPGPIADGACQLTNLNWMVSESELRSTFKLKSVTILNDFQAAALGTLSLQGDDYITLNHAQNGDNGVRLVLGAGTGLGMAYLHPDRVEGGYTSIATEGGHVDFAPATEQEFRFLQYLKKSYTRVSYERILSGSGLVELFCFCAGGAPEDFPVSAAWVNRAAAEKANPIAEEALTLFAAIYGRFAGNMVLAFRPGDGLYLTGGVTAKVSRWLDSKVFLDAYLDKGRMVDIVAQTPVYLVTNERLGLQGAINVIVV